jgi:multiple sugar transport system ATP-binding protein
MAEILVEDVAKKFGPNDALRGVSLRVKDGEFVVLLGPSGSGKTTLLRCVAGLESGDRGKVSIGGRDVTKLPPRDRNISMVFQSYALFPLMTVRKNIGFPLTIRGEETSSVDKRVLEVSEKLGMKGALEKYPRQLSGGEQQRVAIARAIVRETNAVLMDEPLSNLDAPLRAQLRMDLKVLQKDLGTTILYVTHDQAEALTLGDELGVMRSGEMLQYGPPMELYSSPTSSFVAGFVGSPPASLLKLNVDLGQGDARLVADGVDLPLTKDYTDLVSPFAGKAVLLAVRAEGISVNAKPLDGGAAAMVELVEPLGANSILDLRVGGNLIRAVVPSSSGITPRSAVWVAFDLRKSHLFEAGSDKLIF